MKKTVIAGAIASLMTAPVMAQNVGTNEELIQKVERLEAEVDYLKENAKVERKDDANQSVTLDALSTTVNKFTWKGDFRYRHDQMDADEWLSSRTRDRIRVRFGVTAKVNDQTNVVLQLASRGGSASGVGADPRSANQDLGAAWDRKGIAIDLAYAEWKPVSSLTTQFGKVPMAWVRTGSHLWDPDLTPEGISLKYNQGAMFASTFGYWLGERFDSKKDSSANTDPSLVGAQLGMKQMIGRVMITGAVSYFDVGSVKNQVTTTSAVPACNANPAFYKDALNNTTYKDSNGCLLLSNDFNIREALLQADFVIGKLPVSMFYDYMKNSAATSLNHASAAGLMLGKASDVKSWEVGYVYQKAEKDAVFGQFHDSDFAGGIPDTKGSVFKAAYVPLTNWTVNVSYFVNKRFMSEGKNTDFTNLLLDLNYKF